MGSAKDYLNTHAVESKLTSATRRALIDRPSDPNSYISRFLLSSQEIAGEPKSYMFPPRDDATEDVLCTSPGSVPCRVCMYVVKAFALPVDFCGIDFAKDLFSAGALALNPIHSVPFLINKTAGSAAVGINGSETILEYLCAKYAHLVPETFLPSQPLKRAKVMEKVNFISIVLYRATMYQYCYPLMGLMSECQYDLCKRDFALDVVEAWCKEGADIGGSSPTLADFWLASLHMGNCWTSDTSFDALPVKWERDLLPKYPSMQATILALLANEGVQSVNTTSISEAAMDIVSFNKFASPKFLAKQLPAGRDFVYDRKDGMVHPNAVAFMPNMKAIFDQTRS